MTELTTDLILGLGQSSSTSQESKLTTADVENFQQHLQEALGQSSMDSQTSKPSLSNGQPSLMEDLEGIVQLEKEQDNQVSEDCLMAHSGIQLNELSQAQEEVSLPTTEELTCAQTPVPAVEMKPMNPLIQGVQSIQTSDSPIASNNLTLEATELTPDEFKKMMEQFSQLPTALVQGAQMSVEEGVDSSPTLRPQDLASVSTNESILFESVELETLPELNWEPVTQKPDGPKGFLPSLLNEIDESVQFLNKGWSEQHLSQVAEEWGVQAPELSFSRRLDEIVAQITQNTGVMPPIEGMAMPVEVKVLEVSWQQRDQLWNQISDQLMQLQEGDHQRLTLKLMPKHLGTMQMEFEMVQGQLRGRIITETQEVAQWMEKAIQTLPAEALSLKAIQVEAQPQGSDLSSFTFNHDQSSSEKRQSEAMLKTSDNQKGSSFNENESPSPERLETQGRFNYIF